MPIFPFQEQDFVASCLLPNVCWQPAAPRARGSCPAPWAHRVRTMNRWGFAEWSVVYGLTEHSACDYFEWYSTGLCRRINWNFPCQSLGANTISEWRWCQRDACVFLWWPQGTRNMHGLFWGCVVSMWPLARENQLGFYILLLEQTKPKNYSMTQNL